MHIEFLTELGAKVTVQVDNPDKLLDVQRQYGKLGWTSGDVPTGGYQFPLDNAPDFDWSLIGARKWTNPEGEVMVMHRGYAYKIRQMDAVESRKMTLPACVKVSRGAKPSDPDHIREKGDGEFEYVTLAVFRGGKRVEKFAEPRQGQQQRPPQQQQDREPEAPQEAPVTVKVLGEVFAQKLDERMTAFLQGTRFEQKNHVKLAAHIVKREITTLADLTEEEAKHVSQVCEREKRKAEESAA